MNGGKVNGQITKTQCFQRFSGTIGIIFRECRFYAETAEAIFFFSKDITDNLEKAFKEGYELSGIDDKLNDINKYNDETLLDRKRKLLISLKEIEGITELFHKEIREWAEKEGFFKKEKRWYKRLMFWKS